jgi:hypothetical protein
MGFKTLPPGLAEYLLQGERDELTDLARARIERIKGTPCPRCSASLHPKIANYREVFTPHDPLPRYVAHCIDCGFEGDPESGLIVDTGNAARVKDPLPFVGARDDD